VHKQALPISKQIILFKFIEYSIGNETISEYLAEPKQLIKDLFDFIEEFDEFEMDELLRILDEPSPGEAVRKSDVSILFNT
jgi:hypothetical protein